MATFFMFGSYSTEALKSISADRTQQAADAIKSAGGEVKSMFALLGVHDLVLIVELPSVEKAMQASVKLAKLTGIAFTTAPAVEVAEFDKLASG